MHLAWRGLLHVPEHGGASSLDGGREGNETVHFRHLIPGQSGRDQVAPPYSESKLKIVWEVE